MKQKLAKEKEEKQKLEAEKIAKAKAEADKVAAEKKAAEELAAKKAAEEKAAADKLAAEKNKDPKVITPINTGSEASDNKIGSGDAKYSIPQALGSAKYTESIKRGNELFKMKRYAEAKPVYEEALKYKPNDPLATSKLAELEKLIKK